MFKKLRKKGKSSEHLDRTNSFKGKTRSNSEADIGTAGSFRELHHESNDHIGYKLQNHDQMSPNLSHFRKERSSSTQSLTSRFRTSLHTIKESVASKLPFNKNKKRRENVHDTVSNGQLVDNTEIVDSEDDSVFDTKSEIVSIPSNDSEQFEDIYEASEPDILEEKCENLIFVDEEEENVPNSDSAESSGYGSLSQPCTSNSDTSRFENSGKNDTSFTKSKVSPPVEDCLESDEKDYHSHQKYKQRSNSACVLVKEENIQANTVRQYNSCQTLFNVSSCETVHFNISGSISPGYTDSEPTRYGSAPAMSVNHDCSESHKRIRDKTHNQLQEHSKKKLTTRTRAVAECTKTLQNKNGERIFVILGNEKDGKSSTAKNILKALPTTQFNAFENVWEPLIIASPTEWSSIEVHGKSRKVAIVIDDMLGIKDLNWQKYEHWATHFDDMCSAASKGNVAIFLPINKRIYDKYCATDTKHELFKNSKIIDLTSENYRYTHDEELKMLKKMLKQCSGAEHVHFTNKEECENIDTFEESNDLYIWNETIENIVKTSTQFGYPQQMREYCSEKKNLIMRSEFCAYPLDFHFVTLQNIRDSNEEVDKDSMFALATIFVNQGEIEKENLAIYVANITKSGDQDVKKKKQKGKKKQNRRNLLEKLADRLDSKDNLITSLSRGTDHLLGWLLEETPDGIIAFSSHLIYNTVGLVCSKDSEDEVIRKADKDFIDKFVRPKGNQEQYKNALNKRSIFISSLNSTQPETVKALQLRISNEIIKNKRINGICGHPIMRRPWFVKEILTYIEKEAKTDMFLKAVEENRTVLYYGIRHEFEKWKVGEPKNLSEMLVETKFWQKHFGKDSHLKKRQELLSLKYACELGNVSTFNCLYKHLRPNLDTECLQLSVNACSPDLVDIILTKRSYFDQDKLRDLFTDVCKGHCSAKTEVQKILARKILEKIQVIDPQKKGLHSFILEANNTDNTELIAFLNDLGCSKDIIKCRKSGSVQSILSANSQKSFKF